MASVIVVLYVSDFSSSLVSLILPLDLDPGIAYQDRKHHYVDILILKYTITKTLHPFFLFFFPLLLEWEEMGLSRMKETETQPGRIKLQD